MESAVLTEHLLACYLRSKLKGIYIIREDYLTNDCHYQLDIVEEIKKVIIAYGRPIHTDELTRMLHHLPCELVIKELHQNREFLRDSLRMYFHISMVDLSIQELEKIAVIIQDKLDEQGYMFGNRIQSSIAQKYPETAERLSFLTTLGVREAVAYMLRDRFTFNGPVITNKGKSLNMISIFATFCQRHTPFTLDDLSSLAKECGTDIYWDTVHENCARINEIDFVASCDVHWDITHTDEAIALSCPGEYTTLKSISYFTAFPYVGHEWNAFLLEQYVATVSPNFKLLHASYAKHSTSGVIVREGSEFDRFDDVLSDALANAHVTLDRTSCLDYLTNAGFINRRKISNIKEIITRAKMLRSQKG